ncbi:MAG TPA: hypothetical protein VF230_14605 [Acidimicrobiales bacterium]
MDSGSARPVTVMFVGGNETQARYERDIERWIEKTYGSQVRVEWARCGWSSNWITDAERVESRLPRVDALVIMKLVRTHLGRHLRRSASAHGVPWIGCTGHGRAAVQRAIAEAAEVVFNQRRAAHDGPGSGDSG